MVCFESNILLIGLSQNYKGVQVDLLVEFGYLLPVRFAQIWIHLVLQAPVVLSHIALLPSFMEV